VLYVIKPVPEVMELILVYNMSFCQWPKVNTIHGWIWLVTRL